MSQKTTVCIVDDHEIFLEGLAALLETFEHCTLVGRAGDGISAVDLILKSSCDLVILDVDIPEKNGIEVLKEIRRQNYAGRVLMLSMYKNQQIASLSLRHGASGYMLKSEAFNHLTDAIECIMSDGEYMSSDICHAVSGELMRRMTKREKEVALLFANGLKTVEISEVLGISHKTVEVHRKNIYDKLSIRNLVDITRIVLSNKLAFEEACPGFKVITDD